MHGTQQMINDQAQLVSVYTDAYLVTGDADFARVAHDVLDYVERCLSDPSGGFYRLELINLGPITHPRP